MGLDIFENEGTSEKGCNEIEDWGFSVYTLWIGVSRKFHVYLTFMF